MIPCREVGSRGVRSADERVSRLVARKREEGGGRSEHRVPEGKGGVGVRGKSGSRQTGRSSIVTQQEKHSVKKRSTVQQQAS